VGVLQVCKCLWLDEVGQGLSILLLVIKRDELTAGTRDMMHLKNMMASKED
jgi:hypothetical protein